MICVVIFSCPFFNRESICHSLMCVLISVPYQRIDLTLWKIWALMLALRYFHFTTIFLKASFWAMFSDMKCCGKNKYQDVLRIIPNILFTHKKYMLFILIFFVINIHYHICTTLVILSIRLIPKLLPNLGCIVSPRSDKQQIYIQGNKMLFNWRIQQNIMEISFLQDIENKTSKSG